MPFFTIEATHCLPVYRQRAYEADTVEQACRLAIEDDWSDQKEDSNPAAKPTSPAHGPGGITPIARPLSPSHRSSARPRNARPIISRPCSAF